MRGEVKDIYIEGGKIVEGSPDQYYPEGEIIDATGLIVMPGGVEIHSHIAGPKVNSGRVLCPEDHYDHFMPKTPWARSGTGYTTPTIFLYWLLVYNYGLYYCFRSRCPTAGSPARP